MKVHFEIGEKENSTTGGHNSQCPKDDDTPIILSIEWVGRDENGGNIYRLVFNDYSTAQFTAPKGAQGDNGDKGDAGTTDYNELQNKPNNLSDFHNDEGFITTDELPDALTDSEVLAMLNE